MGHDRVSNHQPHHCLLNRLFGRRSKKTAKLRVTGLWVGNSPGHKWPVTRKLIPIDDVIMSSMQPQPNYKGFYSDKKRPNICLYRNPFWPNDPLWRHKPGSTLAHIKAYLMRGGTKPSPESISSFQWILWYLHYSNLYLHYSNFPGNIYDINLYDESEHYIFKMAATSRGGGGGGGGGQWVKTIFQSKLQLYLAYKMPITYFVSCRIKN